MSIKVIREKPTVPPVEKVIVEFTPDEAKFLLLLTSCMGGGDEKLTLINNNLHYRFHSVIDYDPSGWDSIIDRDRRFNHSSLLNKASFKGD